MLLNAGLSKWLRFMFILVVGVAISSIQLLVREDVRGKRFILLAISLAVFSSIPVVYKLWTIRGESEISNRRWVIFLVLMAVLLSARRFGLIQLAYDRYPWIAETTRYLSSAAGGWLLPSFGALVVIVLFLVRRLKHRGTH